MLNIFKGRFDLKETRIPEIIKVVICQWQYNQLSLQGHYYTIAMLLLLFFSY